MPRKCASSPLPPVTPSSSGRSGSPIQTIAFCVLIAVATLVAFAPSLANGFLNWDDNTYVTENPDLRLPGLMPVVKAFTGTYSANYQPVTMLAYIAEFRCFGLDPAGYHRVNLLLHILNALLVFALIRRLSGTNIVGLIGSLLFAVHPLRAESVAWVAELKDVLSTVFFLASLLFYLRFVDTRSRRAYLFSVCALVLSLLSKPMAVSLPVVLLLIDFWKGRKLEARTIREKLPFVIPAAIVAMVAIITQKSVEVVNSYQPLSLLHRIEVPFYGLVFYLLKTLLPIRLCGIYSIPPAFDATIEAEFAIAIAVVLWAAAMIFLLRKRSKALVFGSMFFLVTLLPVLQIVPVGSAIVADRYTYVPMIGFAFAAACGIGRLIESSYRLRLVTVTVLAMAIAASAFATRQRCTVWKDSMTFWNDVISVSPGAGAYYNRGTTLLLTKRYDLAIEDLTRAIQASPRFAQAYTNRGSAYYLTGRYEKAVEDYTTSLQLKPGNPDVIFNRKHVLEKMEVTK